MMKNEKPFIIFLVCILSCTKQTGTEAQIRLPQFRTFYWEENSEDEFLAINFDSLTCNLYSFGPKSENSRERLIVSHGVNEFQLTDSKSNSFKGYFTLVGDSMILVHFTGRDSIPYQFVLDINSKFERMFNKLKSKYAFECIRSNEIAYNGITPDLTSATPYLTNAEYQKRENIASDEIYGTEKSYYLESGGNKFYYNPTGQMLFSKIEIVSNAISTTFLNIRIGDDQLQVHQKLKNKISGHAIGKSETRITVCNSRFEGHFGTLLFKFSAGKTEKLRKLEMIIYEPLNE